LHLEVVAMKTHRVALLLLATGVVLGGCATRDRPVPAASPSPVRLGVAPFPSDRIVAYPEGRYELRGDGSVATPYFWVWIPAGTTPPGPLSPSR
jgi:hypothetical protein